MMARKSDHVRSVSHESSHPPHHRLLYTPSFRKNMFCSMAYRSLYVFRERLTLISVLSLCVKGRTTSASASQKVCTAEAPPASEPDLTINGKGILIIRTYAIWGNSKPLAIILGTLLIGFAFTGGYFIQKFIASVGCTACPLFFFRQLSTHPFSQSNRAPYQS